MAPGWPGVNTYRTLAVQLRCGPDPHRPMAPALSLEQDYKPSDGSLPEERDQLGAREPSDDEEIASEPSDGSRLWAPMGSRPSDGCGTRPVRVGSNLTRSPVSPATLKLQASPRVLPKFRLKRFPDPRSSAHIN